MLETEFETADGAVRVIDFMPRRGAGPPRLMRIIEGLRGRVPMRMELALRPDYGAIKPWVERASDGAVAQRALLLDLASNSGERRHPRPKPYEDADAGHDQDNRRAPQEERHRARQR